MVTRLSLSTLAWLLLGCAPSKYLSPEEPIRNGGQPATVLHDETPKKLIRQLPPGIAVVYWHDGVLGLKYGPCFANPVETRIARDLLVSVTYSGLDVLQDSALGALEIHASSLDVHSDCRGIESQTTGLSTIGQMTSTGYLSEGVNGSLSAATHLRSLAAGASTDSLLATLAESGVTAELVLRDLHHLLSLASLLSGDTLGALLDCMCGIGLVPEEDMPRLLEYLASMGLLPETAITSADAQLFLLEAATQVDVLALLRIVGTHGLGGSLSIGALQAAVDALGQQSSLSTDELVAVLLSGGLTLDEAGDALDARTHTMSAFAEERTIGLHTEVESGAPSLHLTKSVSHATTYYGGEVEYSLTVRNSGERAAHQVLIVDSLPVGLHMGERGMRAPRRTFKLHSWAGRQIAVWRLRRPIAPGDGVTIAFAAQVGHKRR